MRLIIGLCFGIVAGAMLLGCIENPGPDMDLGQEKAKRFTEISFRDKQKIWSGYSLKLEVKRIKGNEHLFILNNGNNSIGLAEIRLILTQSLYYHSLLSLPSGVSYERYIKIEHLNRGQKVEVGLLDSVTSNLGQRWNLSADFLSIIEADSSIGSALGGFYSGTYASRPNQGRMFEGKLSGLIDILGNVNLTPEPKNPEKLAPIIGFISLDSSRQGGEFTNTYFQDFRIKGPSKVRIVGESLAVTLLNGYSSAVNIDTIDIVLKKYIPSKSKITITAETKENSIKYWESLPVFMVP